MPLLGSGRSQGSGGRSQNQLGDNVAEACMADGLQKVIDYLTENQELIWPTLNALEQGYIKGSIQQQTRPEDRLDFSHNQVRIEDLPKYWVDWCLSGLARKGCRSRASRHGTAATSACSTS